MDDRKRENQSTEPKHVVALSGGKDSTAMALRLAEVEPRDYEYIGNFTGNELPELFEHLELMECVLGKPIKRVQADVDLYGLIERHRMIPNFRARFCTVELKIEPTIAYMQTLPPGSVLYVGLRADEEEREGIYGEDLICDFPFRRWGWGIEHVIGYLLRREINIPARTDCGTCFYQRLGEWWNLWKFNRPVFMEGVTIERKHGHTFRSPGRDTWPVSLEGLAEVFAAGRVPKGADVQLDMFGGGERCRVCSL